MLGNPPRARHLLADYYGEVRALYATGLKWWYGQYEGGQAKFAADLAKHTLGRIYWPSRMRYLLKASRVTCVNCALTPIRSAGLS